MQVYLFIFLLMIYVMNVDVFLELVNNSNCSINHDVMNEVKYMVNAAKDIKNIDDVCYHGIAIVITVFINREF